MHNVKIVGTTPIERFDVDEPAQLFDQFEATLRINKVPEADRYEHLLAGLNRAARQPVAYKLQSPPEDATIRYHCLKELLIEGHGKTKKQKVQQLLDLETIGYKKPSTFYAYIHCSIVGQCS